MVDSVTRAHGGGLVPLLSLSAGEKLRRAGHTLWGGPFRDGKKHSEPQDRQQGETDLHGRRGTTRRGGAKPRGRHAGGTGCLAPKGAVETRNPGVGLSGSVRWRGDLWKPQERQFDRQGRTAWIGTRRESRRQGQEGRARMLSHVAHPGRRDLEGPGAPQRLQRPRAASKVEEGSGKATSRGIDRGSPPVDGPRRPERAARNRIAACMRNRTSEKGVVISHARGPSVRGGERRDLLRP